MMNYTFASATILLVLITDPVGNIPIFANALKHVAPERRPWVILREILIAFMLLLTFMFVGERFLQVMNLSELALQIGGTEGLERRTSGAFARRGDNAVSRGVFARFVLQIQVVVVFIKRHALIEYHPAPLASWRGVFVIGHGQEACALMKRSSSTRAINVLPPM